MTQEFIGKNSIIQTQPSHKIVLKRLKHTYPSEADIQGFRNEYDILKGIDLQGVRKVLKYEFKDQVPEQTLEYIEGDNLDNFLSKTNWSLVEKLRFFIKLTQIVGRIHHAGIIHKDLNPNNILITKSREVYVIDFGIASKFTLKQPNLGNPETLEGTLAYISPEQTGRMNRSVDYRTDLYALGVVLYQLLTQKLPFERTEPMELVYAHLAEIPASPTEVLPEIPEIISKITLKLLAKNPEDRYQSAMGLSKDLEKCLSYLTQNQEVLSFELAEEDFSGKLQIPEKLYGREAERRIILDSFDRISKGHLELTMVAGYSGTGKSALVNEIHRPLTATKGYFVEGKFDQFQRNIPFSAWIQVFRNFVDLVLTENETSLSYWKSVISEALGGNAGVLTKVIPNLEAIIGEQPTISELVGQEAQNRFNYTILNFVKAITSEKHPLIIFIDDLQWADLASLNLFKIIATNQENSYLLCVGAYRDNEVSATHPLVDMLKEIAEENIPMNRIHIGNLDKNAISELLSDTLHLPKDDELETLTDTILTKTQGNAFFTHQFIKNLYEEELLRFSFRRKKWVWDKSQIEKTKFTDNVVDLMAQKVQKLPNTTQRLLQLSACIGNTFDRKTLEIIAQETDLETALEQAILEGLIFPTQGNKYKFLHDRIQQASYSLIPETEKQTSHLKIGQLLLESLSEKEAEKHIFDIANHYNLAYEILDTNDQKNAFQLNYKAAQKAQNSASFDGMLNYILEAEKLLSKPEKTWTADYKTTLEVYKLLAEAFFSNGDFENAEKWNRQALDYAQEDIDKAEIKVSLVLYLTYQGSYNEAIELGSEVLEMLGIEVPKGKALEEYNQKHLMVMVEKIKSVGIKNILDIPEGNNRVYSTIIYLCSLLDAASYASGNALFHLFITLKTPEISMREGNVVHSCKMYSLFGLILGGVLGEYKLGYELVVIAVELSKRFGDKGMQCQTGLHMSNWIRHWVHPLRESLKYNLEGLQLGMEGGEIQMGVAHVFGYLCNLIGTGRNLAFIQKEFDEKYWQFTIKYKNVVNNYFLMAIRWGLNSYSTQPIEFIELYGEKINEADFEQACLKNNVIMVLISYYVYKIQATFILEKTEEAHEYVQKSKPFAGALMNFTTLPDYNLYTSLFYIASYRNQPDDELLEAIDTNQAQMKLWVENCPENFLHKYQLIQAEQAQISEKPWYEILELYDQAIQNAKTQEFIQDAALANELSAKYLFEIGKSKIAEAYLQESYQLYKQWGAMAKVEQLQQKYPYLFSRIEEAISGTNPVLGTTISSTQTFDNQTIIKATTSLSKKIRLNELVEEMLYLLTQNSGATKIALLRKESDRWFIEADQEYGKKLIEESIALVGYENLPQSVVSFVIRSKNPLMLQDISQDEQFAKDTYIQSHQTKSILAVPVVYKAELVALLYLENQINAGVFHLQRYELVSALTTQLAISMENTLLYENLESKVQERTHDLQTTNEELQQTQEELEAQRDALAINNIELEDYKYRIGQSIKSAKLIQNSILPINQLFEENFSDYFILYLPKDVVSGDFYWFHQISEHQKILIEADSTGHGVPGAFMTLIGHAIINQIIRIENQTSPSKIMENIHEYLVRSLQQETTRNHNGMDLIILVMEENVETWQVTFGSAGQKLYYTSPTNSIEEIQGSRRKIGGFSNHKKPFEDHTLHLPQGTRFYLCSDGFIDQNDAERKKLGSKKLKALLQDCQDLSLNHQKEKLVKALKEHQKQETQRDDITVIGVEL